MTILADGMWPQLHVLGLGNNKLGANHMAVLEKASFAGLLILELHGNALDAAAMKHLSACKLPCLHSLRLDNNHLDNSAMVYLAQGDWPKLEHLRLEKNFMDAASITELTKGNWLHLQHLQIDRTAAPLLSTCRELAVDKLGILQSHAISPIRFGSNFCEGPCLVGVTKDEVVWFETLQREPYDGKDSDACGLGIVLIFALSLPLACVCFLLSCTWTMIRFMQECIMICCHSILACVFVCTWNLIRFVKGCIVKCIHLIKLVFVASAGLVINCIK